MQRCEVISRSPELHVSLNDYVDVVSLSRTLNDLHDLGASVDMRLTHMDQRLTQTDRRTDHLETSVSDRIDKLETSINTRFDAMDERLGVVEAKVDDVHTLMTQVRDYFEERRQAGEES
jgi:hypothetical protein